MGKRFFSCWWDEYDYPFIFESSSMSCEHKRLPAWDIVDLLNNFDDEVKSLKRENARLKHRVQSLEEDNDEWLDSHDGVDLSNNLDDEIIMLRRKLDDVVVDNADLIYENDKLRCEINKLRLTVSRKKAYIRQLTGNSNGR